MHQMLSAISSDVNLENPDIDLHVEVPLVDFRALSSNTHAGKKSELIRQRVIAADPAALPAFGRKQRLLGARHGGNEFLRPRA